MELAGKDGYIVAVETMDELADRQIAAKVRKPFAK